MSHPGTHRRLLAFAALTVCFCRPPARLGGPVGAASATPHAEPTGAGPTGPVPSAPDECASPSHAAANDRELTLQSGLSSRGVEPFTLLIMGGGQLVPLFELEGSNVGADRVHCTVSDADTLHLRIDCQDGPQVKSADVRLASDRLRTEVVVDGARAESSVTLATRCGRFVSRLPARLTDPTAQVSHACLTANPTRVAVASLRMGLLDFAGARDVSLEVPSLHIHRSLGSTTTDECASRLTARGWMFANCLLGDPEETGFAAKVVAIPGEIVVMREDGGIVRVATPCDVRVTLVPLGCTQPDGACDGGRQQGATLVLPIPSATRGRSSQVVRVSTASCPTDMAALPGGSYTMG